VNPLEPLIAALKAFPGVGEKSAQRMAFFLLSIPQHNVNAIAQAMVSTRASIRYCNTCFNLSAQDVCHVCKDTARERHRLCVVAEPKDIFAIERTHMYKGVYHVLGGLISPLDGVQPESLRIAELINRLKSQTFEEILFAINPTVEGDSTIMYISAVLKSFNVTFTKLAYGLPMGSDIDYADELTLTKAITDRHAI